MTRALVGAGAAVALVGLAHRTALFFHVKTDLDALIVASPGWYTYQQLPVEMLRDHFARSLLFLQQVPPVSNVVMGVVLKVASWPFAATYTLVWVHTLLSIMTALVLVHLLAQVYPRRPALWIVVGVLFLLNSDLVVLEYNSLGQTFYEAITMFFVILAVDLFVGFRTAGGMLRAGGAGLAVGLLALTRASWGLFFLPGLVLILGLAPRHRIRAALAFLLPVLSLQGGWMAKNWVVYGIVSPMASTMGGIHAGAGMANAGLSDEWSRFMRERVTAENGYERWEVDLAQGVPGAWERFLEQNRARDVEQERAMGFPNTWFNTVTIREFSELGQRVFVDLVIQRPGLMADKWTRGYAVFWRPIADYGRMFVALFAGGGTTSGLDVAETVRQLRAGTLPAQQVMKSGTCAALTRVAPCRDSPTSMYTLRWLEPYLLLANVIGVHVLAPLALVGAAVRRIRHADRNDPPLARLRRDALLIAVATYAYCAVLVNVVETSENMRYRLEVEPVIWLITLVSATELARQVRMVWNGRRAAISAAAQRAPSAA